jgi:shikimate kinase
MNVLLMGLRASGKSTLGPMLAGKLGFAFLDLDDRTSRMLGSETVREAWDRYGQEEFRKAEFIALREVLQANHQVVALGGGTPTAPGAHGLILDAQGHGGTIVLYLRATPSTLRARQEHSPRWQRPSITGKDPLDEIPDVFAERDPLYSQLADVVVGVDAATPAQSLGDVRNVLADHGLIL